MVLGICAIPVDYVLKCVPDKMCPELGKKKRKAIDSGVLNLRRKRTETFSNRNLGSVHRENPRD